MIEAYTVGATLELFDVVSAPLLKIAKAFEELDVLIKSVQGNLKGIGAEAFGIKAVANASKDLDRYLAGANLNAERLEKNLARVKALGIGSGGNGPPIPIPGYGGGSRRGGGSHGGIHYGAGGVGMSSATMGLGDAFIPIAIGATAAYGADKLYESAKDYQSAFVRFQTLNLGDKVNKDADAFATGTQQFGVSAKERMQTLRDLHEIMGDYQSAKELTPLFTEMIFANKAVYGEEGAKFDHTQSRDLGKTLEMRGGTKNIAEMRAQADLAQKAITGAGGVLTFHDFFEFQKTGGIATRLLSGKAFWEESAPMIQEMGGLRFGTALMSAHQNLMMGRGSKSALTEAMRLGIIDPRMVEINKTTGRVTRVAPGGLKDGDLYDKSKFEYLLDVLIPAIKKQGVIGQGGKKVFGDKITDDQVVNELNYIFSQRTAANAFSQMYLQRDKIKKNIAVTENAMGLNQIAALAKKSPVGAEAEFDAAWEDFKREWGKSILPTFTSWIKSAADLLRTISGLKAGDPSAIPKAAEIAKNFGTGTMLNMIPGVKPVRDLINMFGSDKPSAYVPPSSSAQHRSAGDVYIDGRKAGVIIAPHVSGVMAKEMNKPQSSSSSFDLTRTMLPVGLTR